MVFDFAAMPPEINSMRMYTGPGSGPMMAAAAAWNSTAADLSTTAAGAQSVIGELSGGEWLGPSSTAMVAAVTPYIAWMETTAGELAHAATQAMASAAAYETAFAMTVPPPVIAANRAQLAALVATNVLGQNTPAILATEAQYGEMWAQDAAAMYGYAGSSASAAVLSPLTAPPQTSNPGGQAAQSAATAQGAATGSQTAGLSGLVSSMPNAMQAASTPLATTAATTTGSLDNFFSNSLVSNILTGGFDIGSWQLFAAIPSAVLYAHTVAGSAASAAGGLAAGLVGTATAAPAATLAGASGFVGAPVVAGLASSSTVGGLSVPAGWSAATPQANNSLLAGSGWTGPEEGMGTTNVATGMPAVASAGRGSHGFSTPRYGVKPTVMPKSVLV